MEDKDGASLTSLEDCSCCFKTKFGMAKSLLINEDTTSDTDDEQTETLNHGLITRFMTPNAYSLGDINNAFEIVMDNL